MSKEMNLTLKVWKQKDQNHGPDEDLSGQESLS
jgi:hypothetical protein